ncbi:hypothetical protein LOZ12_005976 [Ophidiomyces ophidiicola]|nr:hypothetical protein LOZ62_005023 [Ophidiomyces ophidiicola]KAI1948854.1 hypothetical protein LOZ59_006262 [Ophidiomyces ophidiicola]KAI2035224.1 hypothetical protein LOZ47_004680 [Ophidiomyces ophidiicola]KAI2062368.1 hypothetical protein LOZ40_005918 [Ophidiomyces ophidiicola]KAI2070411.1 hypothetical protein LOZ37_005001 [Ophidiomyces ophidiicola]
MASTPDDHLHDHLLDADADAVPLAPWRLAWRSKADDRPLPAVPATSHDRQRAAAHDHALDVDALLAESQRAPKALAERTVLYLAYGSNMSARTFRHTRGIEPLSQLAVCVPSLALAFDLAGLPYLEPCFAAAQHRDQEQHQHSNPDHAPLLAAHDAASWHKPLVGVVYEVTLADYARIIATEGGGASYTDLTVDCFPFADDHRPYDPAAPVPARPATTPFRAHTLLAPARHSADSRARRPGYPQPSPRYLALLVAGAREHRLPHEYRAHLATLQPYRATTARQRVARVLFALMWAPPLLALMSLGAALADQRGRTPCWLAALHNRLFAAIWWTYDLGFARVFGDGERTIGT